MQVRKANHMRKFLRAWKPVLVGTTALMVGAASLFTGDGTKVNAADTTFVYAGSGSAGVAIELFLPRSVAVNEGDTVEFVNPYEEPHTVTFGEFEGNLEDPASNVEATEAFDGTESFNSGLLAKDDHFTITFADTGIYTFYCLLHPGMEVDVTVVAEGTSIPPMGGNSPAVTRTIEEALAIGEAASADALADVKAENAGESDKVVVTGPEVPYKGASIDVMRFLEPEVDIATGSTVTWRNETGVPHTVTFFNGPPPEDFSPFVPITPGPVYDSSKFYNAIISAAPPFGGITEVSLTFDKPGTYSYVCVLHVDQGMAGVINVGGAGGGGGGGGGITPPSTGDAGLLDRSSGSWMMLAGVVALMSSFLAAAVVVVRKDA